MTALFSRQIAEVLSPTIERSVNMLWRDGEFGVIPGSEEEAVAQAAGKEVEYIPDVLIERLERGEEVYQIVYKTKAANAARAEEYMGILDIMQICIQAMNVDPAVGTRLNLHNAIKELAKIRGVAGGIIRQDDEVEAIQAQQQQQQQQAMMMETAPAMAGAVKDMAQAEAAGKKK